MAEYFRQEVKNLNGLYADIQHKDVDPIYRSNWFVQYFRLLTGNAIGKVLADVALPKLVIAEMKFDADTEFNLTKLLLALRVYYADTNTLPAIVDELVPNYISKVPKDPFDDKELRYRKLQKIIYSVGSDMKDDQGDKEKDLCIELAFH